MINSKSTETFLSDCNLTEMVRSLFDFYLLEVFNLNLFQKVGSLDDLNNYFVQPEEDLRYDER